MAKRKKGRDSRTGGGKPPRPINMAGGRQVGSDGRVVNKKGKKER